MMMLARRQAIPQEVKRQFETSIIDNIVSLSHYQKADVITLYMPIRGEVDLLHIWQSSSKVVLFPKVCGDKLAFHHAQCEKDFTQGCFGVPEPICADAFDMNEIDLIIVPGVVFDRSGYRLGYGKGFFDRLIHDNPGVMTLGVCFDEFYVDRLPVDPWDASVNLVVTQTGVFRSEGEV
jgi:5-formyltetrahydrofolate cyclo-ligase